MRRARAVLVWLILTSCAGSGTGSASRATLGSAGSGPPHTASISGTPHSTGAIVDLPSPTTRGSVSLEAALASRRSIRDFTDEPLTASELGQLLWAAQGVTARWGGRTAPSAGALYPLEVYAVTEAGLFHYLPNGHQVEAVTGADLRGPLALAALGQAPVRDAPAVLVVTGVVARTEVKYGDRAERYVLLEAGHAAQNVLLESVALGLGAVPIGAFRDEAVGAVLGLEAEETPLYLLCVGHPAPDA
ncbi:MAG: SagB/ThcOx family dehydrogenase [Candidatus Velamenicoccus archaeovorus]